eukprot:487526-Rhodomonas_salina.2
MSSSRRRTGTSSSSSTAQANISLAGSGIPCLFRHPHIFSASRSSAYCFCPHALTLSWSHAAFFYDVIFRQLVVASPDACSHKTDASCTSKTDVPGSPFSGEFEPFLVVSQTGIMMLELTSDATIFFPGFIATFDARPALDANNLPKPTRFPGIFAPGQWHHIAASVAASGRVRFFLDGALVHTATDGRAIDAPLSGGFAV